MKFITFFAFLATVGATTVYFSRNSTCDPGSLDAPISICHDTVLTDYDITAARIEYDVPPVWIFKDSVQDGCGDGEHITVSSYKDCLQLPFKPRCVRIICA